jgi:hypothetical protein
VGYFEPQSSLEVLEWNATRSLYLVSFKLPDGGEVRALCRPEDIGREPPQDSSAAQPVSRSENPKSDSPEGPAKPRLFDQIEKRDAKLWEMTPSQFEGDHSGSKFKWVSANVKDVSRSDQRLPFLDRKILETLARFKDEKLDEVSLLIFGRGDLHEDIRGEDFQRLIDSTESSIDTWLGTKGLDAWIDGNAADTKRRSWFQVPLRVDMEWSMSQHPVVQISPGIWTERFRAEFLRVHISEYDGKQSPSQLVKPNFQKSAPTVVKRSELKEHIKKLENGDVFLEGVPMVDQGQKGYCVVASMERVMRYYGLDLDQNELAKAAQTQTEGGTSPDAMYKALRRLGGQFSMAVRNHVTFEWNDFFREVDSYNRLAKKSGHPVLNVPRSGLIDVMGAYGSMEIDLLRQVRSQRQNDRTKFLNDIALSIDRGSPVFWGVALGIVKEKPELPQARGGHMRLIIGYNKKTSEIIYSDSWGAGHELKRMSLEDAFFITNGLFSAVPSS